MGFDTGGGGGSTDPNIPDWKADGNSPTTATGAGSVTLTLADTYDIWWVFWEATEQNGSSEDVQLRLNGISSSTYDLVRTDGTVQTGQNQFNAISDLRPNEDVRGSFMLLGRWGAFARLLDNLSSRAANLDTVTEKGQTDGPTSPLSSITLRGPTSADWTVEAYGRDI